MGVLCMSSTPLQRNSHLFCVLMLQNHRADGRKQNGLNLSGDVLINVEIFPLGSERFWLGGEFSCSHIAMSEFFIQTHLNMYSFSEACLIKSSMLKTLAFVAFWMLDIIMGCWFPMFIIGV